MESRMNKGLKNIYVSLGLYFFQLIFSFISRTIFIKLLGSEYLGLNGLFCNILAILTLAESGIGNAMTYALYKPLKLHNNEQIKTIMALYKKMYNFIGVGVLIIGGVLTPFLPILIKDMPEDMPFLSLYYLLYVLNCGLSYFNSYYRTILICDQKLYLSNFIRTASYILLAVFQTIGLLFSHNFAIYLIIMVFMTLLENYIISRIARKQYPYLKEKNVKKVDKETGNEIISNVKAIFLQKVGWALISSTDNIILSKFMGLVTVGLYSNYTLIINVATRVMDNIFSSLTASVGNLLVDDDTKHSKDILRKMIFVAVIFHGFIAIGMFCMMSSLISLWIGSKYVLGTDVLFIICLNYYIAGIRRPVAIFKDAGGIFWQDRYRPLIEASINLVVSIPLTMLLGIKGTLLGTLISSLVFSFWYEAKILYEKLFHEGVWKYLLHQFIYAFLLGIIGAITYFITSFLPETSWIMWFIKGMVCIVVMAVIICLVFRKNVYFLFCINLVKEKLLGRFEKNNGGIKKND